MKENFIHVCFVIDSSGSMCGSEADVIGGFKRVVDEQKAIENGSCAVTVIDFNSYPEVVCVGKDVHDIDSELNYAVGGGTALFDAIRLGIDKTHEYNMSLDNAERPEKTMVVIMTDGGENCSRYNSGSAIKDKIKEMETEFGWSFVYLGSDLSDVQDANTLGIKTRGVSTKSAMMSNYDVINSTVNVFRCATGTTEMKYATMDNVLENSVETLNANYETSTGIKIN
jgi:uncharacterized protein YegL